MGSLTNPPTFPSVTGDVNLKDPAALDRLRTAMQSSNWPIRKPSWVDPSWWSQPLTLTSITVVPGTNLWVTVLTVPAKSDLLAVIQKYTLTAYVANSLTGMSFQPLLNGALISSMNILGNAEYNRSSPITWPTSGKPTYFALVNDTDVFQLQAKNPGPLQQTVMAAAYGYYAYNQNPAERSDMQGRTDN